MNDSIFPSSSPRSDMADIAARAQAAPPSATPDEHARRRAARRALLTTAEPETILGRVASLRASSGAVFADIHQEGRLAQICAMRGQSEAFLALGAARLGDMIEARGAWSSTRSGDRALFSTNARVLASCDPGFPTWDEPLSEQAARVRPDLARASDPIRLGRTRARFAAIEALRDWARNAGLREAITPILSPEPSGALAAPFWTHSSSAGRDLALRVAPENALIRLLCSGIPALYEIGPSFRNEGFSRRHHPEFLMMEAYRVGWSMSDALEASRSSIDAAWHALGGSALEPWVDMRIEQAILAFGCPADIAADRARLQALVADHGAQTPANASLDELRWIALEEVFDPPSHPCAVIGHPESCSPLAAPDPDRPGSSLRFELYLGGIEVANGYEQLRDPNVQARRFHEQAERSGAGLEAMGQDAAYLDAMTIGMPMLAGFGIGIDRLAMLASGCSIREALAFPLSGS